MSAPAPIAATFERTAEGLLAARVENLVWLALPVKDGIKIASGWRFAKPLSEWTSADFHGADGVVADEAAFRAHVEVIAEDRRQKSALGRTNVGIRVETPWGWADHSVRYAEGIYCFSTPSHGGFLVDAERLALMPAALRHEHGWYEEDEQWAKVATAFPHLFTDSERGYAEKTLRDWEPDAWEAIYGRKLEPSESFVREREQFERDHASDWVVISVSPSTNNSGQVECVATLGGTRDTSRAREFIVPSDEYDRGQHGFVIDEARHIEKRPTSSAHLP